MEDTLLSARSITGTSRKSLRAEWRGPGVGERTHTQTSKSVFVQISLTHCMNAGIRLCELDVL